MVVRHDPEHPEWVSYVWNVKMVTELLEAFGWKRVENE